MTRLHSHYWNTMRHSGVADRPSAMGSWPIGHRLRSNAHLDVQLGELTPGTRPGP